MNAKRIAAFALPLLLMLAGDVLAAQNVKSLYQRNCASCHGRYGEKPALNKARALITLNEGQITEALTERRAGKIQGAGSQPKKRLTDEDIQQLAAYIQTLKTR